MASGSWLPMVECSHVAWGAALPAHSAGPGSGTSQAGEGGHPAKPGCQAYPRALRQGGRLSGQGPGESLTTRLVGRGLGTMANTAWLII